MTRNTKPASYRRTKTKIDWSKQFDRIVKYSYTKFGYEVIVKENIDFGEIDFNKLEIRIKSIYNNKENMSYLLLHELGHVIQKQKAKTYKRRITEVIEVVSKSSLSFRTTMLYEEMDAWNEAHDLAKKLRLPLDRKKFETYKSRCLKTYMVWVISTNQKQGNKQQVASIVERAETKNIEDSNIHYEVVPPSTNIEEDCEDQEDLLNETTTEIFANNNNNKQCQETTDR